MSSNPLSSNDVRRVVDGLLWEGAVEYRQIPGLRIIHSRASATVKVIEP